MIFRIRYRFLVLVANFLFNHNERLPPLADVAPPRVLCPLEVVVDLFDCAKLPLDRVLGFFELVKGAGGLACYAEGVEFHYVYFGVVAHTLTLLAFISELPAI